jgi:hypothetical protein
MAVFSERELQAPGRAINFQDACAFIIYSMKYMVFFHLEAPSVKNANYFIDKHAVTSVSLAYILVALQEERSCSLSKQQVFHY